MIKKTTIFLMLIGLAFSSISQNTLIPKNNYTLISVSSDNTNKPGSNAIDNDTTTSWALWNANGIPFPAEIQLDLGANFDVSGFSYLPYDLKTNKKLVGYEVYVSTDGVNWGNIQSLGDLAWTSISDISRKNVYFGAINGRYVKIVYTSNSDPSGYDNNIFTNDLVIYESTTAATGQQNQLITFDPISDKHITDAPFITSANNSTGLPLTYSIVSGPATINNNVITLNGTPGMVIIKAENLGNATYYSSSTSSVFEVLDLSNNFPESLESKLSGNFPIEMPSLTEYPIYTNVYIERDDVLSMEIEYEVVGDTIIKATKEEGYFLGWWKPKSYGNFDIKITATASNGNQKDTTINVDVTDSYNDINVQTFNGEEINFNTTGRWFSSTYELPQSIGAYDEIIANFAVTCPNGDCDDWDRKAYVEYKSPDGTWLELFRYMTPYGIACNHKIDVTDYASLLHGNIELRMFIDTWGTGGWNIHLDFDYNKGTPQFLYSQIKEVWHGTYSFGDPANLQPMDTVKLKFPSNAVKARFRINTTGHAWGSNNTGNAAEFFEATHNFGVDGVPTYDQYLYNQCNPNPDKCFNQKGTWQYNRAGWCPGTIPPPDTFDLSSHISKDSIDFSYVFQTNYQDDCHPNNPNCVTGVTCSDCNDNYNPNYLIAGYLITYSNIAFGDVSNIGIKEEKEFDFNVYPNPIIDEFSINIGSSISKNVITIENISGQAIKTYFFKNSMELNQYKFNVSSLSKGIYFVKIQTEGQDQVKKISVVK